MDTSLRSISGTTRLHGLQSDVRSVPIPTGKPRISSGLAVKPRQGGWSTARSAGSAKAEPVATAFGGKVQLHAGLPAGYTLPAGSKIADLSNARADGLSAPMAPHEFETRVAGQFAALSHSLEERPPGASATMLVNLRRIKGVDPHRQADSVVTAARQLLAKADERQQDVHVLLDAPATLVGPLASAMTSAAQEEADLRGFADMSQDSVQALIERSKGSAWPIDAAEVDAFRAFVETKIGQR